MWNKSLSHCCKVVQYDDNRLLGISVTSLGLNYLILNVYLPYFTHENVNDYDMYMAKIASILDSADATEVVVLGDFNANPTNPFYEELQILCDSKDLIISDVAMLPGTTFTHLNNGTLSKSWVDHCICSHSMHEKIVHILVDENYHGSDHLPMYVHFDFERSYDSLENNDAQDKIKWNFNDSNLCTIFYAVLWQRLNFDPQHTICSCQGVCQNEEHRRYLIRLWTHFVETAQEVGREVFGIVRHKSKCIPGWNDFIKDFYTESREAFKNWKDNGCPRFGPLACYMRSTRANFKYILRQCWKYEEDIRALVLSNKLQDGEMLPFWRDIQSLGSNNKSSLPGRVDGAVGGKAIASLWREKFNSVLNSVNDSQDKNKFFNKIATLPILQLTGVTVLEVQKIVRNLKNNKAVGLDAIPNELYKYAPQNFIVFISITFNAFFNHSFLPDLLMNVLIVPLLKGKYKDPTNSGNYRPIAIATSASKIFESLVYERIKDYLKTTDNQFGFKQKHSTDLCIYTLKEIISYYRKLNTPIYLCFVDIKSAFDRISYWKLLNKLIDRGVPLLIILLLKYWFTTQSLLVGWGGYLSSNFNMKNGIRQGSILSPHFFSVYVDELNHSLNSCKAGCYLGNKPMNNLSYADDLVLIAPSAAALNDLLKICDKFAIEHHIIFSGIKSVCMRILPPRVKLNNCPSIYLGDNELQFVNEFIYLGHTVTSDFSDDRDILKEMRKLCYRGNCLTRKFKFCNDDVKCTLFKSFCYSLYCCSLWSNFKKSTLQRLKVNYNNIMRRLMGLPTYSSASYLFATLGVRSFNELLRANQYSLMKRVEDSSNILVNNINVSNMFLQSDIRNHWFQSLFR